VAQLRRQGPRRTPDSSAPAAPPRRDPLLYRSPCRLRQPVLAQLLDQQVPPPPQPGCPRQHRKGQLGPPREGGGR